MKSSLLMLLFLLGFSCQVFSQTPAKGFEGSWQGTLEAGGTKLRLVLNVTKSDAGAYAGKLDSLDQGATIPIDTITINGDAVRLEMKSVEGVFEGTASKFVWAHWDGTAETEAAIKEATKATIRCIPLAGEGPAPEPGRCVQSGRPSERRVLFARNY